MATITVPMLNVQVCKLRIRGTTPLIVHRFTKKAQQQIIDKQGGKAANKKAAKIAEKEFEDAKYKLPDGRDGFPAVAFKTAAVSACRYVDGLKMTHVRGAMHVMGEVVDGVPTNLVALDCDEPELRSDPVTISLGKRDIRHRPQYNRWQTTLTIHYNANVITVEQIVNLFNNAGFGIGVGEWRPSSQGSSQFGMFEVVGSDEVAS